MAKQTMSLGGTWQARSTDGKYTTEVRVPGSLMEALEKDGCFGPEGLFWRENNRKAEEIAHRDFTFKKSVSLDASFVAAAPEARLFMEADGIDTLATFYANGKDFQKTANMHRRYRFPMDGLLKAGENVLEIRFADTIDYITKAQEKRSLWHSYWGMTRYAVQGFNRIRKSHCSFGWDWGPIVPDVGVWRDLRLVRYDRGRLGTPLIRQSHGDGSVELEIRCDAEVWTGADLAVEAELRSPSGALIKKERARLSAPADKDAVDPPLEDGCDRTAVLRITVDNPELWWPAGLGAQPLYALTVRLLGEDSAALDETDLTIGLRTMKVRREKDQWGESFAFEANGVPFFARGGDWIPEDVYLTRADRTRLEGLIADAAAANFNCLRVWGGGVYPSNDFYDLCDKYGLVVWEDLMFACATYDVRDPEFRKEIVAEVADNLRRIRHHASLGLVCGNNEMEWGFVEWNFNPTNEQKTEYLMQYQFIFPEVSRRAAPDVYYWPASPSSGGDFEDPNSPNAGDTHFWAVWHGNKDFKEYEKHFFRFMSEFGFESFPSMRTIESFTLPEDRNVFSPVMEDHQRCDGGNQKIFAYISKYFRFPADLPSLVYLSQVSQAEAIRHGVEHWRRNRGRCMGAVYWQYNDNWPVASWASVDYYGRWKALHYAARRSFQNVLLSCPVDGGSVELHLSNEGLTSASGTVSWSLRDLSGATVKEGAFAASAAPLSSQKLVGLDFSAEISGDAARDRVFFFSYSGSDGVYSGGMATFAPPKSLSLRKPTLRVRAVEAGTPGSAAAGSGLAIAVSSDVPVLFAELYCDDRDLVFSDNFFPLDGKTERFVRVERGGLSAPEVQKVLKIRTLRDTY